jgi:hypothetical protein
MILAMAARLLPRPALWLAAALALTAAFAAQAAPRYEKLVLSDDKKSTVDKRTFSPKSKRIYLSGWLVDVPPGAKLKAVWFAEKNAAMPDNYRIDTSELVVKPKVRHVTYTINYKGGLPVGSYRVELFIDDKPTETVRFNVAP